jgi:hypothetical protein
MYKDLEKTHAETLKAFELIINSYKFRLIQLCKTHLRDGYITEEGFVSEINFDFKFLKIIKKKISFIDLYKIEIVEEK